MGLCGSFLVGFFTHGGSPPANPGLDLFLIDNYLEIFQLLLFWWTFLLDLDQIFLKIGKGGSLVDKSLPT